MVVRIDNGGDELLVRHDPVFGTMQFDRTFGGWTSTLVFPASGDDRPVRVRIGGGAEPAGLHRAAFRQLERRYARMQNDLAEMLLFMYRPFMDVASFREWPRPADEDEMWRLSRLREIVIQGKADVSLAYTMPEAPDPEAPIVIALRNWRLPLDDVRAGLLHSVVIDLDDLDDPPEGWDELDGLDPPGDPDRTRIA